MQLQARSSTAAAMADDDKVKSTDKILQALDALSQLNQARATRRSNSLPLPRSGSSKEGSDAGAVDAAVEEAQPRPRVSPRLSPTSPFWSKPNKLDKNEKEGDDDSSLIIIIKPRHRLSLMLPFWARSKLIKKQDDDYDEYDDYYYDDDDSAHSALLKTQGFAPVTPEADGEKKGITYHGPIHVMSQIGMRRMVCLFSVEVVAAQGLPPSMNGLRLAVTVRRKETRDGAVRTMPARVRLGAADFDEVLCVRCHLYGSGGGFTGRPISFEPLPFVLSLIAIDAPELDLGRSTVDLGLCAKEFTDKRVRQWDMVFPLAGKAKGGELVVKLAFQSIDDDGSFGWYSQPAGEEKTTSYESLSSFRRSLIGTGRKRRVVSRKLRRSSISNMLKTLKTTRTKMDVPAPDLRGINSFKLDEPEPELTPIGDVKETQQKEPECEPADKPTPVAELEELEQQNELEHEPTDESTPVTDVEEEEQQTEPEQEPTDEPTRVAEVEEEEEEQQKEAECEPTNEPTPVAKVEEEEQQKEPEHEPAGEPTLVAEVKEEQQKELECEPVDEPALVAEMEEEEQQKEPEHELEDAQEDDDSKLPEFDMIDNAIKGQEVKVELGEEVKTKKGSEEEEEEEALLVVGDEVAKAMPNGLEEKSVEATMPRDVSDTAADAVDPMNGKTTRPEEVTEESLQVPEQGEDKSATAKLSRPRFKWRTVALLIPLAVLNSKTLGAKR